MSSDANPLNAFVSRTKKHASQAINDNINVISILPGIILVSSLILGSTVILLLFSVLESAPPSGSLDFTLEHYSRLFDSAISSSYVLSLSIAVRVTLICVFIGYPVAYFLSRSESRYRNVIALAILLPLWVNLVIKAYSWRLILGEQGLINYLLIDIFQVWTTPRQMLFNDWAVVLAVANVLLPFIVLPLYAGLRRIDTSQIEATKDLGANRLTAFLTVVFPRTIPNLAAGGLLVFILAFGEFPTPEIVGGDRVTMTASLMASMFRELNNWGLGSSMAVAFTLIVIIVVFSVGITTGVHKTFSSSDGGGSSTAGQQINFPQPFLVTINKISISERLASGYLKFNLAFTLSFLYFPLFIVALLSFSPNEFPRFPMGGFSLQWYGRLIPPDYDAALVEALFTSLQLGIISAVTAAVLGTLAVIGVARNDFTSRIFNEDILSLAFILPMVIPWIVSGIAILTLFSFIGVQGTFTSLVIGHTFLTIPFVFTVVSAQYSNLDTGLEEAARDVGATQVRTLYEITLPLLRSGIIAGVLFAFSISFDNFTQTFFWSGPETRTLPIVIFSQIRFSVEPTINAIGTIIVVLSLITAFAGERFARRYA